MNTNGHKDAITRHAEEIMKYALEYRRITDGDILKITHCETKGVRNRIKARLRELYPDDLIFRQNAIICIAPTQVQETARYSMRAELFT